MTTAERTRRHRLKHGNPHRGTHSPVPPEPSVCERCAGLAAKLDAARSRVAELEGQLRSAPLPDACVAELEEALGKERRLNDERRAKVDELCAKMHFLRQRKGLITKQQFNKMLACLHTDRSMSDGTLNQCFHLLKNLEFKLVKPDKPPKPV